MEYQAKEREQIKQIKNKVQELQESLKKEALDCINIHLPSKIIRLTDLVAVAISTISQLFFFTLPQNIKETELFRWTKQEILESTVIPDFKKTTLSMRKRKREKESNGVEGVEEELSFPPFPSNKLVTSALELVKKEMRER